jgi:NitT/TauT family transport system substrate-binding protein
MARSRFGALDSSLSGSTRETSPMTLRRTLPVTLIAWFAVVSLLHGWLNLGLFERGRARGAGADLFRVGFLPVTCHLTCPVTHFINESMTGDGIFEPIRFSGWPELKETYLAGDLEATFLLAPMAMALREQGVRLKIVYLGHRDGTTLMVRKDSTIRKIEDLRGRKIAVPNRFSNQRLIIYKALKDRGMKITDVGLVEMPPPDMPAALYSHAVDAIISGEPFMAQSEMDGYGRVLFYAKDVWPEFISCVLAVPESVIETRREDVQRLVDGIAKSGKWLDRSMGHRMQAAEFSAAKYYHQDPKLLRFVLSKPPDRVKYTNLRVLRKDFEEIEALGREAGILKGTARFEDYTDTSFVPDEDAIRPYDWEATP